MDRSQNDSSNMQCKRTIMNMSAVQLDDRSIIACVRVLFGCDQRVRVGERTARARSL
jgi:hypothetical protein